MEQLVGQEDREGQPGKTKCVEAQYKTNPTKLKYALDIGVVTEVYSFFRALTDDY